jgi:transcriptional regulator with XRE-family HTH domain
MPNDVLTSAQCRQARKLLGWQMRDLRAKSQVSIDAISRLERGEGRLQSRTLRDLRVAFEGWRGFPKWQGSVAQKMKIQTETHPKKPRAEVRGSVAFVALCAMGPSPLNSPCL